MCRRHWMGCRRLIGFLLLLPPPPPSSSSSYPLGYAIQSTMEASGGSSLQCLWPHLPYGHGHTKRWCRVKVILGLVVGVCAVVVVVRMLDKKSSLLLKFKEDSYRVMSWEGFGPEKGVYNFTVVTAMLDIGRGQWPDPSQRRSYNTYLLHMHRVLRLDVNLLVYVDAQALPFVLWMRRGRQARTRVVEVSLPRLPYYAFRDQIQSVMDSPTYREGNELVQRGLCESWVPEYDIVQWSKLYFLNESLTRDPFRNELFVWLDGGYGHGEPIHPEDGVWRPKDLFEHADKVTLMEREPVEKYRAVADRLHKMSVNVVAGGFVAGGKRALRRLYALQQQLIKEWLGKGVVDDDQSTYIHLYFRHPDLFRLVPADWDDVFKLFHHAA